MLWHNAGSLGDHTVKTEKPLVRGSEGLGLRDVEGIVLGFFGFQRCRV